MKKWVLVDVSYLAHRALHSVGYLSLEDTPTGVIFGFFHQLRHVCEDERVKSNKVVMFFDSDYRESFRLKAYPLYKSKRKKKREEDWEAEQQISILRDQVEVLRKKILPDMGVQCLHQEGLESDDLMAYAAKQLQQKDLRRLYPLGDLAVMITADGDLYQCISDAVHWFDPARSYYDPSSFYERYNIMPRKWGEVKCIAGCKSDNVAGVPGVGEASAIRYLNGTLPPRYKRYKAIETAKAVKIQKRNYKLVILPHEKTKPFKLKAPVFNSDAFFKYCEEYGLQSFLKKRMGWMTFLHGNQARRRKKRG